MRAIKVLFSVRKGPMDALGPNRSHIILDGLFSTKGTDVYVGIFVYLLTSLNAIAKIDCERNCSCVDGGPNE